MWFNYICTVVDLRRAALWSIAASFLTNDLQMVIYIVRHGDETKETPWIERRTRISCYHSFPLCSIMWKEFSKLFFVGATFKFNGGVKN